MTEPRPRLSDRMEGDHDDLNERWELFQRTPVSDRATRHELFDSFRSGLTRHIAIEEEDLFPRMLTTDPSQRGLVERLLEEHRGIKDALDRLAQFLETGSGPVDDLAFELTNLLGEHNAREEAYAYPWLDDHLPLAEVDDALRRLRPRDLS